MKIREAEIADLNAIAELGQRAFQDEAPYFASSTVEEIEDEMKAGNTYLLGFDDQEQLAGHVCVRPYPLSVRAYPLSKCGQFRNLAVEPLLQNQGYGSQLLEEAERRLKERGCKCIAISILDFKRDKLAPFYKKRGYGDAREQQLVRGSKKPCSLVLFIKPAPAPES